MRTRAWIQTFPVAFTIGLLTASLSWPQAPRTGQLDICLAPKTAALRHSAFMITVLKDGRPVRASEARPLVAINEHADDQQIATASPTVIWTAQSLKVPEGMYDIRLQGVGTPTQLKTGVYVAAGDPTRLVFDLAPGAGVKVIEFEPSELAVQDLLARLKKLEALVAQISAGSTR